MSSDSGLVERIGQHDKCRLDMIEEDLCPECGGDLDTGWECMDCGYDAMWEMIDAGNTRLG